MVKILNDFLKDFYVRRCDHFDSSLKLLMDYRPILTAKIHQHTIDKLDKLEMRHNEKLIIPSMNAGIKEKYASEWFDNKLDHIEKSYYWKHRAAVQKYKRSIKNADDRKNAVMEERRKTCLARLDQEKQIKITQIQNHYGPLVDMEEANRVYVSIKTELGRRYAILKTKWENADEIRLTKHLSRLDKRLLSTKRKLEITNRKLLTYKVLDEKLNSMIDEDVILKLDQLSMHFGGLKAVDNLSFSVKKGEIFGLIGPNGAGKTTVFNCITRFYRPTSGTVYYRDRFNVAVNLNNYKVHNVIREGIVRTFQNIELIWEISVIDNLLVAAHTLFHTGFFGHLFDIRRLHQEEAVIRNKAQKILSDLDLTVYQDMPAYGLPYGILKRIELARTLMVDPQLIILDEPAAGLNDHETENLAKTIRKIRDEYHATIFLVEHDMGLVMEVCDTICAISFGKTHIT